MKNKFTQVLLLIFLSVSTFAQKGKITGVINDAEVNDIMPFANAYIKGTTIGATSDFEGDYTLEIEEGVYTVVFSFIGYETIEVNEVVVKAGETTDLNVTMRSSAGALDDVIITTTTARDTEASVLTLQRNSVNLMDALASQTFAKIGAGEVSSAVRTVPGVSVQDGKYVYVRGLGDRYTKSILNGMDIPGLDPDRNTLQLDLFPTNILDNIQVIKVAEQLGQLSSRDRLVAVHYLLGSLPQGRIGIGYSSIMAISVVPASEPSLTIAEVDSAIADIAAASGTGSVARRQAMLDQLFARATAEEQHFLAKVLVGELRQGALDGVMVDGIAEATALAKPLIRRAWMVTGDLPGVAALAFTDGAAALGELGLEMMRPVLPMLAQTIDDPGQVFTGELWRLETKLDGARIQAHKVGEQVRLFSRSGRDLTAALPDVAELVATLPVGSAIVDGETLSLDADGVPRPFQVTMRRVGRRLGVTDAASRQPVTARFFDLLSRDGQTLIDRPLRQRLDELFDFLPEVLHMDAIETDRLDQAEQFFADAIDAGHEGVMLKRLDSPYELGNRGGNWRKWKAVHTIELVVLAAEWGSASPARLSQQPAPGCPSRRWPCALPGSAAFATISSRTRSRPSSRSAASCPRSCR